MKSILLSLTIAALLGGAFQFATGQATTDEFTVIVLPDTQFYSQSFPETFEAQTKWIAANRSSLNIKFVLGVGDIVNGGGSIPQWENADRAIDVLDAAGVPYVLPLGNHDYDQGDSSIVQRTAMTKNFNRFFGPARYQNFSWYKGHFPSGSNENFYTEFTVGEKTYLVLVLEFYPRDAALSWASSVLEANPDKEVIVVTHSHLNWDETWVGRCDSFNAERYMLGNDNEGEELWEKLLKRYGNIRMVLSGHVTGDGAARLAARGIDGNLVNQILSNYQHEANGGNGFLRILRFKLSQNQVAVETYSPSLNQFKTDPQNQFTVPYTASGTATNGSLVAHVRSAQCEDLAQASVMVEGGPSGVTGSGGKVTLQGLAPGDYLARASKTGLFPRDASTHVEAGYASVIDLFLPTDPGAEIITPDKNARVVSPFRVLADGYGSKGVRFMQVWVDGVKILHRDGNHIDTPISLSPGTGKRLTVTTNDNAGVVGKTTVVIDVLNDIAPPPDPGSCPLPSTDRTVAICQPSDGATLSSPVRILASANSSRGVNALQVYVDGQVVFEEKTTQVDISRVMDAGSHHVEVKGWDSVGPFAKSVFITVNDSSSEITCPPPTANPQIVFCTPRDGAAVTSPVRIVAKAHSTKTVSSMQIYVDGFLKFQANNTTSIDQQLAIAAGTHRITVKGWHADGSGSFSTPINITVR